MTIDQHEIRVTIGGEPFDVFSATTTLDRGWAPYVQGRFSILADELLDSELLDPRRRQPVTVWHRRRFSDSKTVAEVSALHAGKTVAQVSAQHAGKTVAQMSATYRTVWNVGGPHGASEAIYLTGWLTKASRSLTNPEVYEVEWCGDEQRAITRLSPDTSWSPGALNVRTIVANALAKAGLDPTLGGVADLVIEADEDGRPPLWVAGLSCWDYLNPIVSAAGLRLYADETGNWHLTDDPAPVGTVELDDAVLDCEESWESDSDRFYDHAVIIYEWETQAGVPRKSIDAYALGSVAGYSETIQGRPAQLGRAQRIVERAEARILAQEWESVADYSLRPGKSATVTLAGFEGVIDAVTWTYPDATSQITLIDVSPL